MQSSPIPPWPKDSSRSLAMCPRLPLPLVSPGRSVWVEAGRHSYPLDVADGVAHRKQPDERFIVKVHDLDSVAKQFAKITAETGNQLQPVFLHNPLAHFGQLRLVADHDAD